MSGSIARARGAARAARSRPTRSRTGPIAQRALAHRPRAWRWVRLFAPLVAVAGCASVVGLGETSLAWCDRPENKHDFCEDFDHANAFKHWGSSPPPPDGAVRQLVASDDSRPNALDTRTGSLQAGESAITGLLNAFESPGPPFVHVAVAADVKVVQAGFQSSGAVQTGAGFLLIEDVATGPGQPTLCFGMVLAPAMTAAPGFVGLALEVVPNAPDCITVGNLSIDGGSGASPADASTEAGAGSNLTSAEGVPIPIPLGEVAMNTWIHLTLTIDRNPTDDSGTVTFFANGNSGATALPNIPPGFLGGGLPELGIATSVTGPAGPFELQFDDVTVDFHP